MQANKAAYSLFYRVVPGHRKYRLGRTQRNTVSAQATLPVIEEELKRL
jgi:hypothetical protein